MKLIDNLNFFPLLFIDFCVIYLRNSYARIIQPSISACIEETQFAFASAMGTFLFGGIIVDKV